MSEPNNNSNTNTQTQEPAPQNSNSQQNNSNTTPAIDYEKLAGLIAGKQSVTEDTVLKSYFKQQGLSAEEMDNAIKAFKDQKAKNTPDVSQMQSQIDTANNARRVAEINQLATFECIKQGVDSKSIPYVLKMADFNGVAKTDGTYDAEKLTAAITKVLEDVPAFKGTAQDEGNNGIQKIGGDGNNSGGNTKVTTGGVPSKRWNKFNN